MKNIEPIIEVIKTSFQRKKEREQKLALTILEIFQQEELTVGESKEVLNRFIEIINKQSLSQFRQHS